MKMTPRVWTLVVGVAGVVAGLWREEKTSAGALYQNLEERLESAHFFVLEGGYKGLKALSARARKAADVERKERKKIDDLWKKKTELERQNRQLRAQLEELQKQLQNAPYPLDDQERCDVNFERSLCEWQLDSVKKEWENAKAILSEASETVSDARKNADWYGPKIKAWCRSQLTLFEKEQLIKEFEAFVRGPKKSEKEHLDRIVRFFQQQGVRIDTVRILDFESVARGLGVQHPQFLLRSPKELLDKMLSSFSFTDEEERGQVRRLLEQGLEKNEVFRQLAVLAFYKNGTPLHLGERLEALGSPAELDRQIRFCQSGWSVVGKSNRRIPYMDWWTDDVYWCRTLLPGPGAFPSEFAWPTYFFFWRKFAHIFDLGFVSLANLDTDATMTELAPCVQSFTLSAGAEKLLATSEGRQKLARKCRIPLREAQMGRFLPVMTRLMTDYLWGHTRNLFSILGVGLIKLCGQRTLVINQFSELSMSVHQGLPFRCTRLKCFRGAMGGRRELDQRKEKCLARYLKVGRPDDLYRPLVELQGVPYEAYLKQQEAAQVTDVDY